MGIGLAGTEERTAGRHKEGGGGSSEGGERCDRPISIIATTSFTVPRFVGWLTCLWAKRFFCFALGSFTVIPSLVAPMLVP
jgi:hypothetical protein